MNSLNKNKVGLTVGAFYALCHFVWVLMVAAGVAKPILDRAMALHFIATTHTVEAFQLVPALLLIVFAFVSGYVIGWVFAALWNTFNRCCK